MDEKRMRVCGADSTANKQGKTNNIYPGNTADGVLARPMFVLPNIAAGNVPEVTQF